MGVESWYPKRFNLLLMAGTRFQPPHKCPVADLQKDPSGSGNLSFPGPGEQRMRRFPERKGSQIIKERLPEGKGPRKDGHGILASQKIPYIVNRGHAFPAT